jgi:hypothetical protein
MGEKARSKTAVLKRQRVFWTIAKIFRILGSKPGLYALKEVLLEPAWQSQDSRASCTGSGRVAMQGPYKIRLFKAIGPRTGNGLPGDERPLRGDNGNEIEVWRRWCPRTRIKQERPGFPFRSSLSAACRTPPSGERQGSLSRTSAAAPGLRLSGCCSWRGPPHQPGNVLDVSWILSGSARWLHET